MTITLCDRCSRRTKNRTYILLPSEKNKGTLQYNGVWFGSNGVTLCDNCIEDLDEWFINTEHFNWEILGEGEQE